MTISRVYLSGGMEYSRDEGREWRVMMEEWLTEEFGCVVFNPNRESEQLLRDRYAGVDLRRMKFADPGQFSAILSTIVDIDTREIAERSDMVICYWDEAAQRGAGTKGELTVARFFRKPVYLVTSLPHPDIPGWILGCVSGIFPDFDELKAFLRTTR